MIRKCAILAAALAVATASHAAALFSGNAFFNQSPTSQLGPVSGSLTITNLANGFDVTGTLSIAVGPGFVSGTLISWVVDRPLNAGYGSGTLSTTTNLVGYSAPPTIGTFGNTSGVSTSEFTNFPVVSTSTIPLNLTAGAATWSVSASSGPFSYTSGGTNYLRQRFDLDGIQVSGPGGTWVVAVPLTSSVNVAPEPNGALMLVPAIGVVLAALRRRRG